MMSTARTIYTVAAYWSWVVLFLVWLPGYFFSKPAVRAPHRGRQLVASAFLAGGFVLLLSRSIASVGPLAAPITPRVRPLVGSNLPWIWRVSRSPSGPGSRSDGTG